MKIDFYRLSRFTQHREHHPSDWIVWGHIEYINFEA